MERRVRGGERERERERERQTVVEGDGGFLVARVVIQDHVFVTFYRRAMIAHHTHTHTHTLTHTHTNICSKTHTCVNI